MAGRDDDLDFDDDYGEEDFAEDPYEEEDEFADDQVELLPCPECGADIYEEAEQCPVCGSYVTHDTSPWRGRPAWWVLLGLLGIAAMILALSYGF